MRLYYDAEKTKEINEKIYKKWCETKHKRTHELPFHISDLVNCEMKFYCRFLGLKEKITRKSIGMMVFGIIGQQIIQMLYPKEEREYETKLENLIYGHIDVYENKKFPLEVKATRKRVYKKIKIPDKWIKQLMAYLALEGKTKGWLIFLNVFTNQISAFALELTKEELINYRTYLIFKSYKFLNSIKKKDFSELDISPEDYENCGYKHECPKKEECKKAFYELKSKWKR